MSLYPFGAIDTRRREPAVTKGQIARILLTFLACALAFTLSARTGHRLDLAPLLIGHIAG
jgi:hypothetical protein